MRRRSQILCIEISILMFLLFLMSFFELAFGAYGFSSGFSKEQRIISEDTYQNQAEYAEMSSRILYRPASELLGTKGSLPSGLRGSGDLNGIWRAMSFLFEFIIIKNLFFLQKRGGAPFRFLGRAFQPAPYLFKLNVLQAEDGKKRSVSVL